MKKFKGWLAKPVTVGGYLKYCIITMLIALVYTGIILANLYGLPVKIKDSVKERFQKKEM